MNWCVQVAVARAGEQPGDVSPRADTWTQQDGAEEHPASDGALEQSTPADAEWLTSMMQSTQLRSSSTAEEAESTAPRDPARGEPDGESQETETVDLLASIVGGAVGCAYLRYMLQQHQGNVSVRPRRNRSAARLVAPALTYRRANADTGVQATAERLLDIPDLATAERAWQSLQAAAPSNTAGDNSLAMRQAAQPDMELKKRIVQRFAYGCEESASRAGGQVQPLGALGVRRDKGAAPKCQVRLVALAMGCERSQLADLCAIKQTQHCNCACSRCALCSRGERVGVQVRYRDGVRVTTKGEKFVVEASAEWDGGSKGKVYTKGKRGKGFA